MEIDGTLDDRGRSGERRDGHGANDLANCVCRDSEGRAADLSEQDGTRGVGEGHSVRLNAFPGPLSTSLRATHRFGGPRATPPNVTCGASNFRVAVPIPFTRSSPASEPKGPSESRFA